LQDNVIAKKQHRENGSIRFIDVDIAITYQQTGIAIMTNLREKMKQEMILRGLSLGTQSLYLRAVIKLNDHYGRSPAKLTEAEVKSFLLQVISSQSYAESTYNIIIHGLKFFYKHVVTNKNIVVVNLPRHKEPQKLPDILSRTEVTQIINVTKNIMHRAVLILTYGAGLRASEAALLTVRDIDSARSVIHIRSGKGKKDRYVTLSPVTLYTLRDYWKRCRLTSSGSNLPTQNQDLVFVNQSGGPLSASSVAAIYKKSKRLAGIKKQGGVHSLRHAYATHALESGADIFIIKQQLGHSSISSTVRYLHMTDKSHQAFKSPIEKLSLL